MKYRKTSLYIVQCLLILLGGLIASCNEKRPDEAELLILYTSDVMNYSLPYDFIKDRPSEVSLANFASYVRQKREELGDQCLVLDNGNKLLGTVPAGYYNYIDTETEPLAFRTERLIGYDAVGIGDKDLDSPLLLHPQRWNPKRQPSIICANLINSETGEPVFQPYKIFERQGIRIAVLGLMSPNLLVWMPEEDRKDIDVEDMIECAAKWMPIIQEEHPDLVVGLCGANLRYQEGGNTLDTYKNPNGSVPTAIRVPGFDVMLMGGSSEREVFDVRNDAGDIVKCIQTGTTCSHCGEVRVSFQREGNNYKKEITTSIVDLKPFKADDDYCRQLSSVLDTISNWLHEPYGELGDTLFGADGFYAPDAYRQLIHKAQLWFTGADISMASCLIPSDTIFPGTINTGTLFRLFPYANAIELIELQGQDIVAFLEYANGLQFETIKGPEDPLLALKRDAQGNIVYNSEGIPSLAFSPNTFTSAAGIKYTVDVSKPVGQRVRVLSMADGSPFDMRKTYKVVINSFQGKDGGQFFSKGLGWDRATIELHAVPRPQFSVRYALQEYIRAMEGDVIHLNPTGSWQLIPESYVSAAVARAKQQPLPEW